MILKAAHGTTNRMLQSAFAGARTESDHQDARIADNTSRRDGREAAGEHQAHADLLLGTPP